MEEATSDALSRRAALGLLLAGAAVPARAARNDAARVDDGLWAAWLDKAAGAREPVAHAGLVGQRAVRLVERAHDVVPDPRHPGMAFVVARRPGSFLWHVDGRHARVRTLAMQDDSRRFEGHALFRRDDAAGDELLTTETDTDTGQGLVVRRDPATLEVRDEWASHGIGPHQLLRWRSAQDDVLVVANGGILTLPQTGRAKLNVATMHSTLALLDPASGALRRVVEAPLQRLSLRHLAVADDGTLGVAMQYEDRGAAAVFAVLRPGESALRVAPADPAVLEPLRAYAGAVAAHGASFAVTCPHGDRVVVWASDGRLRSVIEAPGVCGIARSRGGWWLSSERGVVYELDEATLRLAPVQATAGRMWDNHLALSPRGT